MRASRGMGAVRASKMPSGKTITRKDNPDKVKVFGAGGSTDDPLKDKTGTKKDPEYGDFVLADRNKKPAKPTKSTPKMAKGGKANWIKGAIKKPGALHEQLGVPKGEKIPAKKLAKAAKAPGKLGQRARFAEVLKGMRKK